MINRSNIPITAEQERTALAWLSVLHDQPDSGDQATFSRWLHADPAHAEAYAQAQVVWELSEVAGSTLAKKSAAEDWRRLENRLRSGWKAIRTPSAVTCTSVSR